MFLLYSPGSPVGTGRPAIRPTMLAHNRLVRCPSAKSSQSSRACFTSRPPVFTSLCCTLVQDQSLILLGHTSRRHSFPR
jgi:hypothetical protein